MYYIKIALLTFISTAFFISCDGGAPKTDVSAGLPLYITISNDDNNSKQTPITYQLNLINIEVSKDTRNNTATLLIKDNVTVATGKVPIPTSLGFNGEINLPAYQLIATNSVEDIDNGTHGIYKSTIASFSLKLQQGDATRTFVGYPQELIPTAGSEFGIFYVLIPNSPATKGMEYLDTKSAKCGYGNSSLKGYLTVLTGIHLNYRYKKNLGFDKLKSGMGNEFVHNIYWDEKIGRCQQGVYQPMQ